MYPKPATIRYAIAALVCLLCVAALTGSHRHSGRPWRLSNVTGYLPALQFSLVSDDAAPVTAEQYRGNIILLYFGFTRCPMECPVTMAHLSAVLRQMGNDAGNVRILFVTIDPVHDTPRILHTYVQAFQGGHVVGLTGSEDAIATLAQRYRVAYDINSNSADAKTLSHSTAVYVFDASGHARLLATPQDSNEAMVTDLKRLIHE